MIRIHRNAIVPILLLPMLLAGGCMHAAPKPQTADAQEMRVEGELAKGEFGCLTVRTADGKRYSLAREFEGSNVGQQVWVEGYVVKTKGCMPGVTLMPQRAGLMGTPVAGVAPAAGSSH